MNILRNIFGVTTFAERENTHTLQGSGLKLMLELTAGCVILLIIRCIRTESPTYIFLLWNLFLAWIPYLTTRYFMQEHNGKKIILAQNVFAALIWLAFLPNAPYILTDLFHLHKARLVPMWFDLIMILSFALTGMVLFFLSFLEFEKKIFPSLPKRLLALIRVAIFIAIGYGLYLGRFMRFNSWDIVYEPGHLMRGVYSSIFSADKVEETLGITFFFAVFLYFGYKLFYLVVDRKIIDVKTTNNNLTR